MKNKSEILKKIAFVLLFVFFGIILFAGIRGLSGNPNTNDLNKLTWRDNGPLELSPERGRFALVYSLIEDGSFYFSIPLARFVVPDLGYSNGHYVSLFAPGVSYLAIPGYLIGKYFGVSQVGTFLTSSFFGLLNLFLIYLIVVKLTNKKLAGLIAGLVFLFASPAFAYSADLYQHHVSTLLILMSIYLLIRFDNFISSFIIFFLSAMSIPVDYPNLFLMLPIGIVAFLRFFKHSSTKRKITFSFNIVRALSIIAVVFPLMFFLWFNKSSYDNPLQFSGTVGGVRSIDEKGLPAAAKAIDPQHVEAFLKPEDQKKSAVAWFKPRNILNGLYIHIFSPDRGIITFTPVILLGIIGAFILYKEENRYLPMLLGIVGANLLLYSMWGDPWGGWAFGSRYIIPSYAILAVLLGVALTKFGKKWWFIVPFWVLLVYSIGVNTLGALTTSTNPPQAESLALEKLSGKRERYSYDRNWEFLNNSGSKSFVYQTWGNRYLTAVQYYYVIAGVIVLVSTGLVIALFLNKNND